MHDDETTWPHGMAMSVSPRIAPDGSEMDLDRSAFDNLVTEIGREDTLQTFSVFFNEADNRLRRLRELSCDKHSDAIEREAHALKGSAGNFGLRQVAELASMLERDARSITPGHYEAALRGLETSYAAACEHFAALAA
jgi:HPt (histidine-containing phosphotransfer) domain-containing protein